MSRAATKADPACCSGGVVKEDGEHPVPEVSVNNAPAVRDRIVNKAPKLHLDPDHLATWTLPHERREAPDMDDQEADAAFGNLGSVSVIDHLSGFHLS